MHTSTASIPAQPDAAQYPLSALYTYRIFDRASYETAFGAQPAAYDPSKPVKVWFATDATKFLAYNDATGLIEDLALDAATAASVNIPGLFRYPDYVPPSNSATFNFFGSTLPVTAQDQFSRASDAQALATAMQGIAKEQMSPNGAPFAYTSADSKIFVVTVGGVDFVAGPLLKMWHQRGIGHPGKWASANGIFTFTPDPDIPGPQPGSPPGIPNPVRPLAANETLAHSPFGVLVKRTDKQIASPEGGSFTDQDRQIMNDIHSMLMKLMSTLKIS